MKEMRPTMGRVVLALFNMLGPLDGKRFLDLFSGSGQISAGALKSGADFVCAVESDAKRSREIMRVTGGRVLVLRLDVRRALARFAKLGEKFDIIFADPPYGLGWGRELPELMEKFAPVLSDDGIFIFEHSENEEPGEVDEVWEREDRRYGGTVLSLYRRRSADA